jgi:hypothetical protein
MAVYKRVKITMKNKGKFVNLQLKQKIKRSQNKDVLLV